MARQYGTTLRNAWLDQWETTIGTSAKVQIRTGAQPSNCAAADSGTLLVEFTLGSDWAGAAASGSKSISGTPISGTASATGTAEHYRIVDNAGTTCHEQGSVATSGGDMTIDNASITSGQTVNITGYTKTAPGA